MAPLPTDTTEGYVAPLPTDTTDGYVAPLPTDTTEGYVAPVFTGTTDGYVTTTEKFVPRHEDEHDVLEFYLLIIFIGLACLTVLLTAIVCAFAVTEPPVIEA